MSVTVRLQGLPPLADSIHIRNFFAGLKIPCGGVNISGGVYGEAFVTFETYTDVCCALKRSGRLLMNSFIYVSVESSMEGRQALKLHKNYHQSKPGYIRISVRPFNATFCDVKCFFRKLAVKSVIFLTKNKVRNGQAIVKFAKTSDVRKALLFNLPTKTNARKGLKYKKCFSVMSMKKSDENEWIKFGGKMYPTMESGSASASSYQPSEMLYDDLHSLYIHEFYAHLMNVSLRVDKEHIKRFLYDLVDDFQITFVYDRNGSRTRECFVMFITENDYIRALGLDKAILKGRSVRVLPIPKMHMIDLIESKRKEVSEDPVSEEESSSRTCPESEEKCIYLRNFAADVTKCDILNFFTGLSLHEKDIFLLYDDNGDGLGEALVRFSSQEEASSAKRLNHKKFQGTEILLRCISEEKMKVFGVDRFWDKSDATQDLPTNKQACQAEELQPCVSVADDAPDVTYDST